MPSVRITAVAQVHVFENENYVLNKLTSADGGSAGDFFDSITLKTPLNPCKLLLLG